MKKRRKAQRPTVELEPGFVTLAHDFGMVPERLAERVIRAFVAEKPTRILLKSRGVSVQRHPSVGGHS